MKDVLIISNYWHFKEEKSSSRYSSIAKMLSVDYKVEVITSTFYHTQKKQRVKKNSVDLDEMYKITLVHESGYKKNVSIKRILSHKIFTKNVLNYLKSRQKPDLIYLFVPPLGLGSAISKFCKENNIKLVIDILDLWPEAFNMFIKNKYISDLMFFGFKQKANYIYKRADSIIAVSQTYLERALSINTLCNNKACVYIGTDLDVFDKYKINTANNKESIKVVYIGMLGSSYDLKCAIDAIGILEQKGVNGLDLIVMGDGPKRKEFEDYAFSKNINYNFTGRLSYQEMIPKLCECDIALNIISKGAVQSIINKHSDYLAAGLPIVNNQEVAEFGELLTKYNCGLNCENSNAFELANAIEILIKDQNLSKMMGENSRKVAEKLFDRQTSYRTILEVVNRELNR